MRLIGSALILGVTLAATAGERSTSPSTLAKLWPTSVKFPAGMKLYRPAQHTQRSEVSDSRPFLGSWPLTRDAGSFSNPNRQFPYVAPGGLHAAHDWESVFGLRIPEGEPILTWTDHYYQITAAAPVRRWSYPIGTVAADILVRKSTGEPFELRLLKKTEDGWVARVPWQADRLPPGYQQTDRACLTCHADAGDSSYGPVLRGNDFLYSPPIFKEGTVEFDLVTWSIQEASVPMPVRPAVQRSVAPTALPVYQSRGFFRRR